MNSIKNISNEYIILEKSPNPVHKSRYIATIKSMKIPGIWFQIGASYIKYNKDNTFNINLPSNAGIFMVRMKEFCDIWEYNPNRIINGDFNPFIKSSFEELQLHFN